MPQCKDCQYQNGRLGSGINVEHLTLPVDGDGVPTIEICPGDFLTKDTSTRIHSIVPINFVSRIALIGFNKRVNQYRMENRL